jgi:cardiolipin synthase (CMP-forming)
VRHVPNLLTLTRLFASPVLGFLIVERFLGYACGLLLLAALTDWFDGWAARKLKVSGGSGVLLDPLADKLLLSTLFIALTIAKLSPLWLLILVFGRDLVIVTGSTLLRLFRGIRTFRPSTLGKVSTFFQIIYVLLALISALAPFQWVRFLAILALLLTALFTAGSGLDYILLGIRLARRSEA